VTTANAGLTELRFQGGGIMRTPSETVVVRPGAFVVHPADELHEYENGPERTLLFRVRYGTSMASRSIANRQNAATGAGG
jgi:hypothetical protein